MKFSYFVGAVFALIGSIALLANSYLLGNGAIRWAHEQDPWERSALAAGGAIVPWLLALWPMLFAMVAVQAGWLSRVGQRGLLLMLWTIFFFYNFAMGTSNLATLREEKVAQIGHSAENLDNKRAKKKRLEAQLAGIPQHRPADAVAKLIEAEKNNRRWSVSMGCMDATSKASRDFCDGFRTLEGELASAQTAERLNTELSQLEGEIAVAPAATKESADPFVMEASAATGMPERTIRIGLAMMTPFILEVVGASCWKIAIMLFGWSLRPDAKPSGMTAQTETAPALLLPHREAMDRQPAASQEALTARRQLCEWFFRENTRQVSSGSMPEIDWYDHYRAVCKRSKDEPLPLETFRRIAGSFVPTIQDIDEKKFYMGLLPLMTEASS